MAVLPSLVMWCISPTLNCIPCLRHCPWHWQIPVNGDKSQMMDGYRCSLTPPPQITWDYLLGTPSFQSPYPFYVTGNHFSMAPESPFWPLKSFFPADTSRKPLRCQVPYRCAWRPLELQGGMAPTCIYLQGVGRTWSKDWALVCELIFFK